MGIIIVLLSIILVVEIIGGVTNFWWNVKNGINLTAFMAQIQKLIMANNIDRALKLCNAEPDALFPKQAKILLTRANRPYSLDLEYQLAKRAFVINSKRPALMFLLVHAFSGVTLIVSCLTLVAMLQNEGWPITIFGIGIVGVALVRTVMALVAQKRLRHYQDCDTQLLKLRNLLYARSKYVPSHFEPRKEEILSQKELDVWRASLDILEKRAESEPDIKADDLYKQHADRNTGVLPPL